MSVRGASAVPAIAIDWRTGDDPAALRDREWLVTNGLGGFASGTLLGIGTRRYHGLFVPNLPDPKGRHVMISRFDEEVRCGGEQAHLGGAEHADGRLDGETHRHLRAFRFQDLTASWYFEIGGHAIEKTVFMPHHHNTVCVHYRLLDGRHAWLDLRPYVAFRRQDAPLVHAEEGSFTLSVTRGRHEITLRGSPLRLRMALSPHAGVWIADERDTRNVLYRLERERGYEHGENLFSPGYFRIELRADRPVTFVASTQAWDTIEVDGESLLEAQRQRAVALLAPAAPPARSGFPALLVTAADQFLVLPGSRLEEAAVARSGGETVRTVIAGYHWFADWGRDTMISLEGLTLCTGRHGEAQAILRTFSHYVKDGLLPNLFPEGERQALYHTADATLWYFHAIERYRSVTGDERLVRELYPVLQSIVRHHVEGTQFGIGLDPADGLIHAGEPGYQLTWMDAKVDDWVVTPRRGKPVEIQALWYNALRLMADWSESLGKPAAEYAGRAAQARAAFNRRYWNARTGWLFDVVDGEEGDDASCRPNQIFALSLRHPVLSEAHWAEVVDTVQQRLLTPFGLRTLSPDHPDYRPNYHGDLRTRDAAYHQGTVWPWLIGHFVDAWLRVHRDRARARMMLAAFESHLSEAGIGSISEVFDAEAPYVARGCIAQAWSVAEVLRAWLATEPRSR